MTGRIWLPEVYGGRAATSAINFSDAAGMERGGPAG
jgi:hypothetical protein